ncbi:MAG: 2-amino-4-hydroxy-6-hydroxymethyldihydropteridine diphosphokinase, partial [Sphingopyxis sp.]|nr:2-amino-4-hydroxy-6-hydroxymethyldihydropteridine diphosphokinase [Sphingopyxis sp.]
MRPDADTAGSHATAHARVRDYPLRDQAGGGGWHPLHSSDRRVGVSDATRHLYAIAIGSNRAALGMHKAEDIVAAALAKIRSRGIAIIKHSATLASAPVGPARRRFGNAAAIIETRLGPEALLRELKSIERAFGRTSGRRWGDRPLDLDIILWS